MCGDRQRRNWIRHDNGIRRHGRADPERRPLLEGKRHPERACRSARPRPRKGWSDGIPQKGAVGQADQQDALALGWRAAFGASVMMLDYSPEGVLVQNIVVGYIPTLKASPPSQQRSSWPRRTGAESRWSTRAGPATTQTRCSPLPRTSNAIDAELTQAGIDHGVRQPTSGRAASEEILLAADEVGADLIVIGVRKRSPVGKVVTGSTVQNISLDAADVTPREVPEQIIGEELAAGSDRVTGGALCAVPSAS